MGKKRQRKQNRGSSVGTAGIDLDVKDQNTLATALSTGGMTRRQAIKWMTAMGVSIVSASSLVTTLSKNAFAATPLRGGRMRVAAASTSVKDTLDPARFSYSTDYIRGFTFYNGLTSLAGLSAEARPRLAESFEPNADATQWVFKLRKGVTFHDGKTLDANDVVYSLMRHKDPKVASNVKALADMIRDVRADGKETVIVTMNAPYSDLPVLLGTSHFMIIENGTTDFTTAIGTGPYKVKEFKPGDRSLGIRNKDYFIEGRPYMEEQELFGISDDVARLNALFSGDCHMMTTLDPGSVKAVNARKGVEVIDTPAPRFTTLNMMVDRPPFKDNLHLRLAIKNLIDREKALKTIMQGRGQLGNDHLFAPNDPFYNTALPQRVADREKAKYHLKKSGFGNGPLTLHVSKAAFQSVEIGMLLQVEAARIGLTIDLRREPSDGYWTNIWRNRSFHAGEWDARPTDDLLLTIGYKSDSKWNETGYKNPQLDSLIDKGRATVDFAKRKEIYGDVQKILYEDGSNLIACFSNFLTAVSSKVKGLEKCRTGSLNGANYADTVWLDT
jgi:peptide/nickel transport system substrate-binding protein